MRIGDTVRFEPTSRFWGEEEECWPPIGTCGKVIAVPKLGMRGGCVLAQWPDGKVYRFCGLNADALHEVV